MGNERKSGRVGWLATALILLIFVPVIVVNTILIVKTYISPEHLPGVFGYKPVIVLSGSMSPVFEPEALIFVKETPPEQLAKGDIICFLQEGTAITHRIDEVISEAGQTSFVTKGDANNTADRLAVSPSQVEGVFVGKIDGLGGFAMFMQSTTGMILFIALPILLYLLFDIVQRRRESKREREHAAQLEAELAALRSRREQ